MDIADLKRELSEAIGGIDDTLKALDIDWTYQELTHALVDLDHEQGEKHVEKLLAGMRQEFDWEVGESGKSREEERLLEAYKFQREFPIGDRTRPEKVREHLSERVGRPFETLSEAEQIFVNVVGYALGERPEEKEVHDQRAKQRFEEAKQRAKERQKQRNPTRSYEDLANDTKGSGFKREK